MHRREPPLVTGVRLRGLSLELASAATRAVGVFYHRRAGDLDALLDVLDDGPKALRRMLPDSWASGGGPKLPYSEVRAESIARSIAVGVHLRLHRSFDRGLGSESGRGPTRSLTERITEEERRYRAFLRRSRQEAAGSEPGGLLDMLGELTDRAQGLLGFLAERAAMASAAEDREGGKLGLRVSALGRRYAMLAAALVMLDWRYRNPRTAWSTARIALSRERLARPAVVFPLTAHTLAGREPGTQRAVFARIANVDWIDRPRKPYSSADMKGVTGSLVVPYKSLRHQGATDGVYVWAKGKIKQPDKDAPPLLEVEFEGSGNHARHVWEDWLAVLARDAYELHPGSLYMEWEYPRLGLVGSSSDLHARIGTAR
jgi:hypothetical protein